jgi:galactokinase
MKEGDARQLGKLMNESHRSLAEDFEVSSDALNAIVKSSPEPCGLFWRADDGRGFWRLWDGPGEG